MDFKFKHISNGRRPLGLAGTLTVALITLGIHGGRPALTLGTISADFTMLRTPARHLQNIWGHAGRPKLMAGINYPEMRIPGPVQKPLSLTTLLS